MAEQLVETRGPARDACLGDLVTYQQHEYCEVVARSNGPDAAVIRTDDGRLIEVAPGEVVAIRHLHVEEPEVEEPVGPQVMASFDASVERFRYEMGLDDEVLAIGPDAEPAPHLDDLRDQAHQQIDRAVAALQRLQRILQEMGS